MHFLVAVAKWLQSLHHDVFSVYDEARGLDDESTIEKAKVHLNLPLADFTNTETESQNDA